MRIHTKLTILLLVLTLIPLSLLTGLDTYILHRLGTEVADDMRDGLLTVTEEQLQGALTHYLDILRLEGALAQARGMGPGAGMMPPGGPGRGMAPGGVPGGGDEEFAADYSQGARSGQAFPRPGLGQGAAAGNAAQFALPQKRFEQPLGGEPQSGATGPISVRVMQEMLSRPYMKGLVVLLVSKVPGRPGLLINSIISSDVDTDLWRPGMVFEPFPESDPVALRQVEAAIDKAEAGTFRADYQDRLCLWAHGPFTPTEAAFMIIPLDRVQAMAERGRGNVLRATRATLWTTSALGLVAVVVVAFMALVASRRVTIPLQTLAGAAQRVAGGDFEARAALSGNDELSQLGRTFDDMVPKLQTQMHMQQALELASEVQRRLLPANTPVVVGVDIAGVSIPCDETGGDYFDFLETSSQAPGRAMVVVGDVTGHGVSAALLMATARGMMRAAGLEGCPLAERVRRVNDLLCDDLGDSGQFMTLFAMELDRREGTARYVRAGHDPALLYDPGSDEFHELEGHPGPLLGIMEEFPYEPMTHSGLVQGQVLLVGTDGVWESFNPAQELYGKERLREVVRNHHHQSADQILEAVLDSLDTFRAGDPAVDDTTLVIVKFTPPEDANIPDGIDRRKR